MSHDVVSGTDYAASRIHAPWCGWPFYTPTKFQKFLYRFRLKRKPETYPAGTWIMTDIKHVGDDPFFQKISKDSHPHLTKDQINDWNAPYERTYRTRAAVAISYDEYFSIIHGKHYEIIEKNSILEHLHFHMDKPFLSDTWNYLPLDFEAIPNTWEKIFVLRHKAKISKNFQESDAIRKVLEGGGFIVQDIKTGTIFKFIN